MKFWKQILLFYLGGMAYAALELLWRGRTHSSMFLLGGACFVALGWLKKLRLSLPASALAGSAVVTTGELATGLAVNRSYTVWDYRTQPMNFLGQICLTFSLLWIPVSLFAMVLYGLLDRKISATAGKNTRFS